MLRPVPTPVPARAGLAVLVVIAVLTVLVTACGSARPGSPEASGGLLAQRADLRGASYVVGGGPSTPLRLLCQITIAAVQAADGDADDECGKTGALDVYGSPQESDVDTGWASLRTTLPDGTPSPDDAVPPSPPTLAALRSLDAPLGVTWLDPTAFDGADVVVTRPGAAADLPGLAGLARTSPVTLCAVADAVPGTTAAPGTTAVTAGYGFAPVVVPEDANAVLAGVATGRCTAGLVPGDAGRVPALGLVVLPDVRGVLTGPAGPRGYAPVMRTGVLDGHPGAADVLGEVTRRLDGTAMRSMVREVEVDGRDPRDVARRWLVAAGLVAKG
ncbi:MAG TPA: glycine betaine ABC transporter substrate-binding protein [Actinomycetospora sp.]|uniref:glycine betaine ABC transporter substrate-binding protein n=1 Tax=Actinomycetospora sp. TaxID=1872135 RepID=UPI002F4148ED